MTHEIDYTEFIDRYLLNEMSSEEKAWFEKELKGNPSLQIEIDFHRKVDAVLSDQESLDLHSQLETIHHEIYETTKRGDGIINIMHHRAYSSAGAIVTVALVLFVYFFTSNYSNDKLIVKYYEPAETSINFRSTETGDDIILKAMALYEEQDYINAIALFERILADDKSALGINLYSGISHMEVHEYEKANIRLQSIINNEPNPFVESATWYLGLCYLFTNEREKAAEAFKMLAATKGYYQKEAKKILRRL
jgi:tetratricopeptide (TPR) repeat protein